MLMFKKKPPKTNEGIEAYNDNNGKIKKNNNNFNIRNDHEKDINGYNVINYKKDESGISKIESDKSYSNNKKLDYNKDSLISRSRNYNNINENISGIANVQNNNEGGDSFLLEQLFQKKSNVSKGHKNLNISRYKENNEENVSSYYKRNLKINGNIIENSKKYDGDENKINEINNTRKNKRSGQKEISIGSRESNSQDNITNINIDNPQNIIIKKQESKNKIIFDDDKNESSSSKISHSSCSKSFFHHLKLKDKKSINQNFSNILKNNDNKSIEEKKSDKNVEGEINEINSIQIDILEDKIKKISKKTYTISEAKPLSIENNFFLCLFAYFKKREIFCLSFLNKNNTTPKFIRRSLFFFCLTIILTINCLLFDDSLVDKRYQNILIYRKKNNIDYFFRNELKISFYSALIGNAVKMLLIKIIINWIFKISSKEITYMSDNFAKTLNENEKESLKIKKFKYLKDYSRNVIIYFFLIFLINIFAAYICICYGAFFENSFLYFILSFFTSYILSFILCYCFCLIIILIYKIWKKTENEIAIALFILLSKLY